VILITGAGGKTGRALIRALAARGQSVRALIRRAAQEQPLQAIGAQETALADLLSAEEIHRAVEGVSAIYHICPNVSPSEVEIGRNVLAAGQSHRVERFVFHSVLHPQTEAMPHHWKKMRVEERIFEAGLPFTILQPAPYMQNVLAYWEEVLDGGVYRVPYPVDTRLGMVDLVDVAEVAARVITESGHVGATYELAGSEVLTPVEVAKSLGSYLGREVVAAEQQLSQWEERALAAGLGEYQTRTLRLMFSYYAQHGLWGNPTVLEHLLQRPPTTFGKFLERRNPESG
jgi:uncharacterized protein YbjT (DUF2867 family)